MELRLLRYFVAVAEEHHFGRAAARLHIAQPSLSRAIKQLEGDLGVAVLDRSPTGVEVTPAGAALYKEARAVLDHVEQARARVATAAGAATLTVGSLAGAFAYTGSSLVTTFRERHPGVAVHVREADFTDPSCGLRAGLVDAAITLAPFDTSGLETYVLRSYPIAALLRTDDPLADRSSLTTDDLADRQWFRFPEGTDPIWTRYWTHGRAGPVVRTAHECVQAVLWNAGVGLVPLGGHLPSGLTTVPLADHPPSRLVIAWNAHTTAALVRSFVTIAAGLFPASAPRGATDATGGVAVGNCPGSGAE